MIESIVPQIECLEINDNKSKAVYSVEPLERGYATTLGNALRRVLLSSLPGYAVTAIRVESVYHEFSTIPGVIEDMTEIILNVKDLRTKLNVPGPKSVYISSEEGYEGVLTAGDIVHDDEVEIINKDLPIATLNGSGRLFMEMTISAGVGYNSAERNKWPNQPIGVIPIDSIFNPVRRVNFRVEDTRVGQFTDFDKLIIELETDGTMTCGDAINYAAKHLIERFQIFTEFSTDLKPQQVMEEEAQAEVSGLMASPIEDLDFSVRTYNCLKRANINTIGDLVAKTEEDMMKVRNLGKKSLEEVVSKLNDNNLSLADSIDEI
ncbi:MAG: DNA-directed RNA polymerase subunit alpha [Eubacteriales bacterium]|nr:DNA-directed RNA polymerase subunit alpha [Eubacteriales bacterium]